jgi:hypothetical protein
MARLNRVATEIREFGYQTGSMITCRREDAPARL